PLPSCTNYGERATWSWPTGKCGADGASTSPRTPSPLKGRHGPPYPCVPDLLQRRHQGVARPGFRAAGQLGERAAGLVRVLADAQLFLRQRPGRIGLLWVFLAALLPENAAQRTAGDGVREPGGRGGRDHVLAASVPWRLLLQRLRAGRQLFPWLPRCRHEIPSRSRSCNPAGCAGQRLPQYRVLQLFPGEAEILEPVEWSVQSPVRACGDSRLATARRLGQAGGHRQGRRRNEAG